MRTARVLLCSLFLVALWSSAPASQTGTTGVAVLFEGARLITGDGSAPIENSAFVVQDRKFTRVGRRGEVEAPAGAARVDLTGKTVIPGLIELHAHLGYWKDGKLAVTNFTRDQLIEDLQRLAYHGVVAVLSLGTDFREVAFPLRDELWAAPRSDTPLYFSAAGMAMPKGGPGIAQHREAVLVVTTEAEARQAVQNLVAQKGDFIKIWHDAGRELMPRPVYETLLDEAHKHNIRVAAHVRNPADFKDLLHAGIDAFAHPTWRQDQFEPADDELITLFKQRPHVPMMATLWGPRNQIYGARPYWIDDPLLRETFSPEAIKRLENSKTPPDAPQAWATGPVPRAVARFKTANVKFGIGGDMGGGADPYFGWSTLIEIESMVKAGLTPAEALVAATRNGAEYLRLNELGMVATGKSADFVVLDADPLSNIANIRRISQVYLRGNAVDRAALRAKFTRK